MNLNSKLDKESLRDKFFSAVGDAFAQGASVHKLADISIQRGVWEDEAVKEQLAELGVKETIKGWMRSIKDDNGVRVYHSIPKLDSEGNEIPEYWPVALFTVKQYKTVFSRMEKRIADNLVAYVQLVAQCRERYGYQHPFPKEVKAYIESTTKELIEV